MQKQNRKVILAPEKGRVIDMPKFKVLRRVDAYVDYVTEVEAEDAKAAAWLANVDDSEMTWEEVGEQQFDARMFVTLDADGVEIEGTQCGDF